MMKKIGGLLVLALIGLLALAACGPSQEIPVTGDDIPAAVEVARQQLATTLGIDVSEIEITSMQPQEWPDACLGLPQEGEVCAQVVTPGFEVRMVVNGQEYVLRTDEIGQTIRSEDIAGLP